MLYRRCLEIVLFSSAVLWCVCGLPGQVPGTTDHVRSATEGRLVAIHGESISVKNDNGTFVFHVNSDTQIWRGGTVGLHELHLGNDVGIGYHVAKGSGEAIATDITNNIANWAGTITNVGPHSVEIAREDEQGRPWGRATIFFDDHADFYDDAPKDLQVGGSLQVLGLDLGHRHMRATKILTLLPPLLR